jgi:AraC-like DNA-binding protein
VRPGDAAWSGQLSLGPGLVVYTGPGGSADEHAHHAVQLVRSFDEPVLLELHGGQLEARAALVPSGVRHRFACGARRMVLALVEPHGPRGGELQAQALRLVGQDVEARLGSLELDEVDDPLSLGRRLLDPVAGPAVAPGLSDPVRAALAYLEQAVAGRPRLDEAAAAAHMSASRLSHRFTEEVGMPFRRYVLWLRLRAAVEQVHDGATLTRAAVEAGFSDSAHLSRVFRQSFGLPPSALLHMRVTRGDWPG